MGTNPNRILRACVGVSLAVLAGAPAIAQAAPTQTDLVEMPDHTRLATSVYLPPGAGPFPVVVFRTPYGRASFEDSAQALLSANVASVAQDMRGRFDSEGVDCVFLCDGDGPQHDGLETLDWVAVQPWCNGRVLTYGASATGIVQYMTAVAQPAVLDAMWVEVATPTLYDHAIFQGGVFRQGLMEGWLQGQGSGFFLQQVSTHALLDDFWAPVQTSNRFGNVRVPAMHVGGWYDIFTQGTVDAFVGYQHQGGPGAAGKQKMIIGPWTHSGMGQTGQGDLVYPDSAKEPPAGYGNILASWLVYHLGLDPNPAAVDAIPTVQYYMMGDVDDPAAPGNTWLSADDWPVPAAPVRLHLQSDKSLAESCPQEPDAVSSYSYDPQNPTPTIGGAELLLPPGPKDQSSIEARSDVLTFSTPVLTQPVEIAGRVSARLWLSIDRPDTDVVVRLTDVYPDGRSMLVLDAPVRLAVRDDRSVETLVTPGEVVEAEVDLWSTAIAFNTGHRIRISVTSSNSPRFYRSANDGTTYGEPANPVPVTVTLHHDAQHPSYLELPVPSRPAGDFVVCGNPGADAGVDAAAEASVSEGGGPDGAVEDSTVGQDGPVNPGPDAAVDAGGPGAGSVAQDSDDGGCSCRTAGPSRSWDGLWWSVLGLACAVGLSRRYGIPSFSRSRLDP